MLGSGNGGSWVLESFLIFSSMLCVSDLLICVCFGCGF